MSTGQNVATVQRIYAAFGTGDVPAILDACAEDVAWEQWEKNHAQEAGVPWLAEKSGRAGVGEFFGLVGGWEIHSFEVHDLFAGATGVIAKITIDASPAEGARFRDEELHLWTFDADGKVVHFRHYVDTAKHLEAARAAGAVPAAA